MKRSICLGLIALWGCASGLAADGDGGLHDAAPRPDASPSADARPAADAAPARDASRPDAAPPGSDAAGNADAAAAPYRHTIAVDGVNDFAADDSFGTTSATYGAYLTWDDEHLYVGYSGADVASGDANKWVLVYLDIDPGAGTGAAVGETYNTEQPAFPGGFGAEYYVRWRADDALDGLRAYGGTWSNTGAAITVANAGDVLEVAIPLAALGDPASIGITGFMINETPGVEAAYAGLYPDSFTDGYHATIPITRYLLADFTSALPPNDPAHRRP